MEVLTWWLPEGGGQERDALICDGAVRSGKTLAMGLSFFLWAMSCFTGESFALCGKTIGACERNVLSPLNRVLRENLGWSCRYSHSRRCVTVGGQGAVNRFYLFGGRDESSAGAIQGMTLAGVLLDEVALMPRSFVEQAVARCSRKGSRFWFNCNPESPAHWFYQEWLCRADEKNALHIHFTMDDNPGLENEVRLRYERLYTGAFYRRFIKGEWVRAQGLIYPMFDPEKHLFADGEEPQEGDCYLSVDYGTLNPFSAGLWRVRNGTAYRLREFYHDGRKTGRQLTDEEYYRELEGLAEGVRVRMAFVDPSAASFLQCILRKGRFTPVKAVNDVERGIRRTASALQQGRIRIHRDCRALIAELGLYVWDEACGHDRPVKQFDHACDEMRYLVSTCPGMAGQ